MTPQRRACDSCSRKKILCDGDSGECDWCRHHGLKCTYDRPLKKRMSSAGGYASTSSFKKRIERLEIALNEAQSRLSSIGEAGNGSSPDSATAAAASMQDRHGQRDAASSGAAVGSDAWSFKNSAQIFSLGRFHLAGHHIGAISSTSCLPVFSPVGQEWVYVTTGQVPSFDKLRAVEAAWDESAAAADDVGSSTDSSSTQAAGAAGAAGRRVFPTREVVEALFSTYCAAPVYAIFPVIEPPRFKQLIEQTYETGGHPKASMLGRQLARASVLAFSAMATLMMGAIDFPAVSVAEDLDPEALGLMASEYLPYLLQEPGLDQCSTLLTLVIFHVMSGHEYQGAMLLSLACRSLLVLNAHTMRPTIPMTSSTSTTADEQQSRRHLRQLFWLAHSIDKEMALRSGLSPVLSDEFCDLTPPLIPGMPGIATRAHSPHGFQDGPSAPPPPPPRQDAAAGASSSNNNNDARFVPPVLALSLMKSRISRILYSEAALHKSGVETLYDIRQLDDELEQWRMTVPAAWRPSLGPTASQSQSSSSQHLSGASSENSPDQQQYGPEDGVLDGDRGRPNDNDKSARRNLDATSASSGASRERPPRTATAIVPAQSPHAVMSRLAYYHLLSVVHRASGRCRAISGSHHASHQDVEGGGGGDDMATAAGLGAGISSSLAISVQASRMTISSLRDLWQCTSAYAFWVIVFYPISAVLAIFCHILLDPASPTVQEDLALIECVPGIVRSLGERRRRRQHARDGVFYDMVDELCGELIRLGNCAVYRAVERSMDMLWS